MEADLDKKPATRVHPAFNPVRAVALALYFAVEVVLVDGLLIGGTAAAVRMIAGKTAARTQGSVAGNLILLVAGAAAVSAIALLVLALDSCAPGAHRT